MQTDRAAIPYRADSFQPGFRPWLAVISLFGIVGALELGARTGIIGPLMFPAPSAIGAALGELISSGLLAKHLGASLRRLAVGWTMGVSTGILAGIAIGTWTGPRSVGVPWVAAISAIPKIALLPLFIIWFGIGEGSKYATIAFGTSSRLTVPG